MATTRDERIELCVRGRDLATLTAAADVLGVSLAEFVAQSALGRAAEVLADLRVFHVPAERGEEFDRLLEASEAPSAGLVDLFAGGSVFRVR